MCHERLREVKEILLCCVEEQVQDLCEVDTAELGEVIDMIKDLEEAIYYCTVTEAMIAPKEEVWGMQKSGDHQQYRDDSQGWSNSMDIGPMEGKSSKSRKMYMEAKHLNQDKSVQLRELEKYMQELSQDVVEMIEDASLEEKQYLEKKISALAMKIGQMK